MFRLELLPAFEGECLILSWGSEDRIHRILIDAGRARTAKSVLDYARDHDLSTGAFELFVITHIDRDHIEGAVELLKEPGFRSLVREVWFNGRADLDYSPASNEFEAMGARDGERLTTLIQKHQLAWNASFAPCPVAIVEETNLPVITLAEGLTITILSPDLGQLRALAEPWDETIEVAPPGWENLGSAEALPIEQLANTRFRSDRAKPNGSSIAMIADYEGRRVLLTGDAHVPRLVKSLQTYWTANPDGRLSAIKASHHGSRGNTSLELVQLLDCPLWMISTNGDQFSHPDKEAVARILWGTTGPTTLVFNYRTAENEVWEGPIHPNRDFEIAFGVDGYVAVDIPIAVTR